MATQPKIYKQGGTSSFQTLNAKYNFLQSQLANLQSGGLPTSDNLFDVLTNGDSAGGLNITNVNNLQATTINGASFPPATPTIDAVLGQGDTATGKQMILTDLVGTQFTTYTPSDIQLSDGVTNAVSFQPTQLQYTDNTGTVSATWADIISGSASSNTLDEVLTAGNTSSQTFILSNSGNTNGQSGSQIVLDGAGTFGTSSNTINKTSATITDTNGAGTTLTNSITNNGMIFSLDDNSFSGLVGGQFVGNLGGTPTANISLGASGVPTPPYPAPNGSVGINATPTTAVVALSQSSPFANASNVNMDLFGISHTQSVGSPSPNNPFTIETNKYLKLKAQDLGGSGYGIFIDPSTPNIYYSLNPATTDRITIDNTGTISSINVGSQRSVDISPNQFIIQDFVAGSNAELSTINLNFQGAGGGTSAFSSSTLTFNQSATASSIFSPSTLRITETSALVSPAGVSTIDAGRQSLLQSSSGGGASPILTLTNTNATGAVATEIYKNKPTAGTNGDVLFTESVYGKDSANTKQEFSRITHTIRDATAGAEDGSMELGVVVNGGFANFIQLNANDTPIGEVNFTRPLDFIGGSDANSTIKTSGTGSVNLNLDATTSAGTGAIALKTKNGVAGSGGGLLLTGNTLLSPTAGGSSGQHLALTIGGVVYKIALLSA